MESTVAAMVVSVMAGITIPSVASARDSYRLQIAADAIRQQLYLCRQRALAANQMCSIRISATGMAQMDTNHNGTFGDTGGSGTPADDPAVRLDIADVTVTSAYTPIVRRFTSRGEISWQESDGDQSITVTYAGRRRVITIQQRGAILIGEETTAS